MITTRAINEIFSWRIDDERANVIEEVTFNRMFDCKYSPNGEYFVIGNNNKSLLVFNVKTRELIHTLGDHTESVFCVAFSVNEQMLASCSFDGTIIIYSLPDFSIIRRIDNQRYVYCICFSLCSNYLYSGDHDGKIRKWDIHNGVGVLDSVVLESNIHSSWIWRMILSSDGKYLLTAGNDKTVKLIEASDFSVLHTFNHTGHPRAISFNLVKRIVASGDMSNEVKIWNFDTGLVIHSFDIGGMVFCLNFLTPHILFVMSGNGYITLYNADNFQELQRVYCNCDLSWFSFDVSPDRTQLVCGRCNDNCIKIYPLIPSIDSFHFSAVVDLSRNDGEVLSTLISAGIDSSVIRQLVACGICMSVEEYKMIVDTCWDLVDINENKGGNMQKFLEVNRVEIGDSDDD
eukprot:TRINITY_DN3266_c1_g2_i9.p1 TRINITY_DN3266_c1_g2~~TRINITY_DN3266_c1_g2_i9.p1  ORF type:complete len:402 (-),score=64.40 TRINITY_DN3266_c1_g2_i9:271-1476(-)